MGVIRSPLPPTVGHKSPGLSVTSDYTRAVSAHMKAVSYLPETLGKLEVGGDGYLQGGPPTSYKLSYNP